MWLPSQDSNLDQGIQSPLCYRYTTRHQGLLAARRNKRGGRSAFPPPAPTPIAGAEGRTRTGTGVAPQQFLRLSRLPIPPLRPAPDKSPRRLDRRRILL